MSKGPSKSTTTQTTTQPAYVEAAQKDLLDAGNRITEPFLDPPTTPVAGFSPDQLRAFEVARSSVDREYASPATVVPSGVANGPAWTAEFSRTPTDIGQIEGISKPASNLGTIANTAVTRSDLGKIANTAMVAGNAGSVTGGQITPFLNPYMKDVLNPTIDVMRRELGRTQAGINARGASGAAFGGSRHALQSAEADRSFGDQVARTTGDLMAQGYDKASALALANAQSRQTIGLANTAAENERRRLNASSFERIGVGNTAAENERRRLNAQAQQTVGLTNSAAENERRRLNAQSQQAIGVGNTAAENAQRQFNALQRNERADDDATRQLTAAALTNTATNDEQRRQLNSLAALLGTGLQQQQYQQALSDVPEEMLRLLGEVTPGEFGGTKSTTEPKESNTISTLGGLVGIGSGLFGSAGLFPGALAALSDERDKTDIKKLGRDSETDLDMYAYRYKGDPKSTPKVVGPMAQQVEKRYPGTTREIGGHKVINTGALRAILGLPA